MVRNAEALVTGGAPVGLFAALSLSNKGASVQVVDSATARLVRGYACCLHPRTAQLFDQAGLLSAIQEGAHRVDAVNVRNADGSVHRAWTSRSIVLFQGHRAEANRNAGQLERVLLVHGESPARAALAARLSESIGVPVLRPVKGQVVQL
jgi:2-polyprenyl-6-methoxyphenol hydroxylase-like FAD-dependent oxidoreductase